MPNEHIKGIKTWNKNKKEEEKEEKKNLRNYIPVALQVGKYDQWQPTQTVVIITVAVAIVTII